MATTYCFLISTAKSLPQFVCGANPHIILALEINSTLHLLVRQRLPLGLPTYWRRLLSSCDNPPLERNHSYSGNKIILFSKNIFYLLHIYYIINFYKNQIMVAWTRVELVPSDFQSDARTGYAIKPWQGMKVTLPRLEFWRLLFCYWTNSL